MAQPLSFIDITIRSEGREDCTSSFTTPHGVWTPKMLNVLVSTLLEASNMESEPCYISVMVDGMCRMTMDRQLRVVTKTRRY